MGEWKLHYRIFFFCKIYKVMYILLFDTLCDEIKREINPSILIFTCEEKIGYAIIHYESMFINLSVK